MKKSDLWFAGNVVSFPSRQISSTRYVQLSSQVMPKFTENFSMTFARKCTYRAPEICRNGSESTFPAKHRYSQSGNESTTKFIAVVVATEQS